MTPEGPPATDLVEAVEALEGRDWRGRVDVLRAVIARVADNPAPRETEHRLAAAIGAMATDTKWEVRKAVALVLGELHQTEPHVAERPLEALVGDGNRWVREAASRSLRRLRSRRQHDALWVPTAESLDPTLQYIAQRIRQIGFRSLSPARFYELATEIVDHAYRVLAGDTAHEIRTLMTPFEGYLLQLRRRLATIGLDDPTSDRYIETVLARLRQMERLVENLRVYSSPADGDYAPEDLASIVREAVALGAERVEPHGEASLVKIEVDVPEGLIIDALRERLIRALANLVANALQAMPKGGALSVRTRLVTGDNVEVAVSDTGVGMTEEMVDAATKRFRTTRRDEGGTGLGLPIAERILVEDHRGDFAIASAPGAGTTITIVLPLRRAQEGA